jgi:hypothetical protein
MHMARTEGVRGMMKGNWTNCVRIVPNSAIKFFTFEQLCRCAMLICCCCSVGVSLSAVGCCCLPLLAAVLAVAVVDKHIPYAPPLKPKTNKTQPPNRQNQNQSTRLISDHRLESTGSNELTPGLRLAAGAGAGIVAMSATYPLDMVRGRLTVQEGRNVQYHGIMHATRTIFREEGALAFYRGWLPSVIGVVPYVGLNFGVYETLKAGLLKARGLKDERELSVSARLACGAAAGTTGQTVAYPFDVARRRLQVSGWQGARELHSDHGSVVAYRGMVDCFVRTVREEGFGALFKVGGGVLVF